MAEFIGYHQSKENFIRSLLEENKIKNIIDQLKTVNTSKSEEHSWQTSLPAIAHVLNTITIPQEITIALEYKIPITERRIDALLTGYDDQGCAHAIIIELKAWSDENLIIDKNSIIYNENSYTHPCYQAFSYKQIFKDYNQAVQEGNIKIHSLVFMYKMSDVSALQGRDGINVFGERDEQRLRHYIAKYLQKGDNGQVLNTLYEATINPSLDLRKATKKILQNNFLLLDEQKIVFDKICEAIDNTNQSCKKIIVVQGDAGTGKTIIAASLLAKYADQDIQYITPNPFIPTRWIIGDVLSKYRPSAKSQLMDLNEWLNASIKIPNILLVDEAHKIENDFLYADTDSTFHCIIGKSRICVFFCDPNQITKRYDEGYISSIKEEADYFETDFQLLPLFTQYRCNGSSKYINWLLSILEIESELPKMILKTDDYPFVICNNPSEITEYITQKQKEGYSARVVIGNCYDNLQTGNGNVFNDPDFHWELTTCKRPNIWGERSEYNHSVGELFHCTGSEFDYIGVIIGPDLYLKNGKVMADSRRRKKEKDLDFETRWYDAEYRMRSEDYILRIKNLYYTLFTRGMRGCYVYFCDKALEMHFRRYLSE